MKSTPARSFAASEIAGYALDLPVAVARGFEAAAALRLGRRGGRNQRFASRLRFRQGAARGGGEIWSRGAVFSRAAGCDRFGVLAHDAP